MTTWQFAIYGKPAGKGSKRIVRTKRGQTLILDDNPNTKTWQQQVTAAMEWNG